LSEASAPPPPLEGDPEGYAPSVAKRLAFYQRAGGIVTPMLTAVFAFLMGGIVVGATGHNPLRVYKAIFEGAGLNWFFHFGNYHVDVPFTDHQIWFWWNTSTNTTAAYNLTQTLLTTTPLILTGLAVAFAFRCGLFNIGGQGQYFVGSYAAVWAGSSMPGTPTVLHIVIAALAGALVGAAWAAIAGLLKATVGANEVITTIMLNYTAIYLGQYLFGLGGPLQNGAQKSVPVSNDVVGSAKLPVFWGDPELQGLHVGIFVALAALVVFWIVLNRSTTGYEVRAVGLNPEAARYGGMSVARNYLLVMAVCGVFAGLAGAVDVLGWQFRVATNDITASQVGFFGIAVALLGRNTAVGTLFSALLFGALLSGTSQRNLDPSIFQPELAANLTTIIQGLVVLFVSADVLVIAILRRGRRIVPARRRASES
jgi:general nucleoside transport system permease protein